MADGFRMTEDDSVGPDASALEDLLELRLLTKGLPIGPVDMPIKDHRLDEF